MENSMAPKAIGNLGIIKYTRSLNKDQRSWSDTGEVD